MFIIVLPLIVCTLINLYFTKNHNYWKKRNVKHDRPIPLFGNIFQNIIGRKSVTEIVTELYNKYPNEKVVGLFYGNVPGLIIRDLAIIKRVLNADFEHFYQRGLERNPEREPVFLNLFHATGDTWKLLRKRLTPAFTSAKLKNMLPLIVECAQKLQIDGQNIASRDVEFNARDLMARFSIDFIGSCGYGLQIDSISNENSPFRNFGRQLFNRTRSWSNYALVTLYNLLPEFGVLWQYVFADSMLLNFTTAIFETVSSERNYKPSGRHDFIDLLLELTDAGKVTIESIEQRSDDGKPVFVEIEMDKKVTVAQALMFFAAGFETSSAATSYLLHQLALHPEEQRKIQEDIDKVMSKYKSKMCYDSIAEMTKLTLAFKEAMRMFPSSGTLKRVCTRRYVIPELDIVLDPGVKIWIPVQGIQFDEKYYEKPLRFNPQRFSDIDHKRDKNTYFPFGDGPRMCIGSRLGEMQSLAGLAAILHKFTVVPGPSTTHVLEVDHTCDLVQAVKGGLPLKLKKRHNETGSAGISLNKC